ncbi:hypothetical protein Dimus_015701 [Dionaea muscipula]
MGKRGRPRKIVVSGTQRSKGGCGAPDCGNGGIDLRGDNLEARLDPHNELLGDPVEEDCDGKYGSKLVLGSSGRGWGPWTQIRSSRRNPRHRSGSLHAGKHHGNDNQELYE